MKKAPSLVKKVERPTIQKLDEYLSKEAKKEEISKRHQPKRLEEVKAGMPVVKTD
jgi:hypothetical protein